MFFLSRLEQSKNIL